MYFPWEVDQIAWWSQVFIKGWVYPRISREVDDLSLEVCEKRGRKDLALFQLGNSFREIVSSKIAMFQFVQIFFVMNLPRPEKGLQIPLHIFLVVYPVLDRETTETNPGAFGSTGQCATWGGGYGGWMWNDGGFFGSCLPIFFPEEKVGEMIQFR